MTEGVSSSYSNIKTPPSKVVPTTNYQSKSNSTQQNQLELQSIHEVVSNMKSSHQYIQDLRESQVNPSLTKSRLLQQHINNKYYQNDDY
jgi:hypothetical protein